MSAETAFDSDNAALPPPVMLIASAAVVTEPPPTSVTAGMPELAELSETDAPRSADPMVIPAPVVAALLRITAPDAVNAPLNVIEPPLVSDREPTDSVIPDVVILPLLAMLRLCPEPNEESCKPAVLLFSEIEPPPWPTSVVTEFDCKRLAPPPPVKFIVSVLEVTEPPLTSLIAEVLEPAELSKTVEPWSAAARLMPALPLRLTAPVAVNASLRVIEPGPVLARERAPSN